MYIIFFFGFRDFRYEIRVFCIVEMGEWMKEYRQKFKSIIKDKDFKFNIFIIIY